MSVIPWHSPVEERIQDDTKRKHIRFGCAWAAPQEHLRRLEQENNRRLIPSFLPWLTPFIQQEQRTHATKKSRQGPY